MSFEPDFPNIRGRVYDDPIAFEHPDVLRGKVFTDRVLPIQNGEEIAQWQALAKNVTGDALVAFESGVTSGPYAISMRAVTAVGNVHSDYIVNAQEFNASKLIFKSDVDSYQGVIEAYRAKRINLIPFNEADRTEAAGDSS